MGANISSYTPDKEAAKMFIDNITEKSLYLISENILDMKTISTGNVSTTLVSISSSGFTITSDGTNKEIANVDITIFQSQNKNKTFSVMSTISIMFFDDAKSKLKFTASAKNIPIVENLQTAPVLKTLFPTPSPVSILETKGSLKGKKLFATAVYLDQESNGNENLQLKINFT